MGKTHVEVMRGNNFNLRWTHQESEKLFIEAVELMENEENKIHSIYEVAKAQQVYKDIYDYLIDKFREKGNQGDKDSQITALKLATLKNRMLDIAAANLIKKGLTPGNNPAMPIFLLKACHGLKDTQTIDLTNSDESLRIGRLEPSETKLIAQNIKEDI